MVSQDAKAAMLDVDQADLACKQLSRKINITGDNLDKLSTSQDDLFRLGEYLTVVQKNVCWDVVPLVDKLQSFRAKVTSSDDGLLVLQMNARGVLQSTIKKVAETCNRKIEQDVGVNFIADVSRAIEQPERLVDGQGWGCHDEGDRGRV